MLDKNLILALKRCIGATFNESMWRELAYLTDGQDIVLDHPRLLRSLNFGDVDYEGHIFSILQELVEKNPENLKIIIDFTKLRAWLKEGDPQLFTQLFGSSTDLLEDAQRVSIRNSIELHRFVVRIRTTIETDPELAIGSTKEMIEAVLKTILEASGEEVGNDEFPKLLKRAQKKLKLDPDEIAANARGVEIVRRTLNNLGQVVDGIGQLRNLYGTGHGHVRPSGVSSRHARLVVNCGAALAVFLMETFEYRRQTEGISTR